MNSMNWRAVVDAMKAHVRTCYQELDRLKQRPPGVEKDMAIQITLTIQGVCIALAEAMEIGLKETR